MTHTPVEGGEPSKRDGDHSELKGSLRSKIFLSAITQTLFSPSHLSEILGFWKLLSNKYFEKSLQSFGQRLPIVMLVQVLCWIEFNSVTNYNGVLNLYNSV